MHSAGVFRFNMASDIVLPVLTGLLGVVATIYIFRKIAKKPSNEVPGVYSIVVIYYRVIITLIM